MRKLMVASFVSLDGVVEAPMTWAGSYFDDECKEYASEKLRDVDPFLLGRITYEMFSVRWSLVKFRCVPAMKELRAHRERRQPHIRRYRQTQCYPPQ